LKEESLKLNSYNELISETTLRWVLPVVLGLWSEAHISDYFLGGCMISLINCNEKMCKNIFRFVIFEIMKKKSISQIFKIFILKSSISAFLKEQQKICQSLKLNSYNELISETTLRWVLPVVLGLWSEANDSNCLTTKALCN
jgi:hypothetical protein